MKNINKLLSHDFCVNSIDIVEDDESVVILTAIVLDFDPSPNKWGITKETCEKYKDTIIGKHVVTKYFMETDTLGGHENNKQKYRDGDFDIPHKDTNSIGTILDVWIGYIDKDNEDLGEAMYVKCSLMMLEHINEVSLIMEWLEKGIKVNLSVEWFYTESVIIDGVEWIANPTFSNICVLNSESKNGKPIVRGNYDIAELGINLLDEMNNAIIQDYKLNEKEGEVMKNRFLEALNGLSFDDITSGIWSALEKTISADEYYDVFIWDIYPDDKYFLTRNWNEEYGIYKQYSYETMEDGTISISEGITVKKEEVFVPISVMNQKVEEIQTTLDGVNEIKSELETKVATIQEDNALLTTEKTELSEKLNEYQEYKEEHEKHEYEEKLNAKMSYYEEKFNQVDMMEKFNSEEVQEKIKEMLNEDELVALKAENAIDKVLLEVKLNTVEKPLIHQVLNSKMDDLIPLDAKTIRKQQFGF